MAKPTKEQWAEVEKQLDTAIFRQVYFRCDDYMVSAGLARHKQRLIISVYVNGWFKGEWLGMGDKNPSEECIRFYMPSVRSKFSIKFVKKMEKIFGKRHCKKEGYYDKRTIFLPWWNRPKPFIRHLIKHNENIEILDYKTYASQLDVIRQKEAEAVDHVVNA